VRRFGKHQNPARDSQGTLTFMDVNQVNDFSGHPPLPVLVSHFRCSLITSMGGYQNTGPAARLAGYGRRGDRDPRLPMRGTRSGDLAQVPVRLVSVSLNFANSRQRSAARHRRRSYW
jgi:hypothetical protein